MDDLLQFLINLFFVSMIAFLVRANLRLTKFNFYNHQFFFTFFWTFLLIGSQLFYPHVLSISTVSILYFIPILFSINHILIVTQFKGSGELVINFKSIRPNKTILKILVYSIFILCLLANLEYVYSHYYLKGVELVALEQIRSATFRDELDEPNVFFNVFGRSYLLLIPWFYFLYAIREISKWSLFFFLLVIFLLSALFLTRAPILITFIYILFCNYFFGGSKKGARYNIGLVFFILFFLISVTTVINLNNPFESSAFDSFKLYLFGGVTAIEELFKGATIAEPAKHFFLYSFDFIFYILLKIGLISEYPSYLRDYVFISDDTTNVYTFLDCFFLDAGYLGVFIGVFFLSTICSLLYIFFKRQKNILSFQLYLLLFTNLSMCFMNNEFIRISFFINVFEIILFNKIIVSKKVTY